MQRALCGAAINPNYYYASMLSDELEVVEETDDDDHTSMRTLPSHYYYLDEASSLITADSHEYGFWDELERSLMKMQQNCTPFYKEKAATALIVSERSFRKRKQEIGAMLDAAEMEIASVPTTESSLDYSHDQSSAMSDEPAMLHLHNDADAKNEDDSCISHDRGPSFHEKDSNKFNVKGSSSSAKVADIPDVLAADNNNRDEESTSSLATTRVIANRSPILESSVEVVNALIPPFKLENNTANLLLAFHPADNKVTQAADTEKDENFREIQDSLPPKPENERNGDDSFVETSTVIFDYSTESIEVALIDIEKEGKPSTSQTALTPCTSLFEPSYVTSVSSNSIEISIARTADDTIVNDPSIIVDHKTTAMMEPKQKTCTFIRYRDDTVSSCRRMEVLCEDNSVSELSDGEATEDSVSMDQFLKQHQKKLHQKDADSFDFGCLPLERTLEAVLPLAFNSCANVHVVNQNTASSVKLETIHEDEVLTIPSHDSIKNLEVLGTPRSNTTTSTITPNGEVAALTDLSSTSSESAEAGKELEMVYKDDKLSVCSGFTHPTPSASQFHRDAPLAFDNETDVEIIGALDLKEKDFTDTTEGTPSTHDESSFSNQPLMEPDDHVREEVTRVHMKKERVSTGKVVRKLPFPNRMRRRSVVI